MEESYFSFTDKCLEYREILEFIGNNIENINSILDVGCGNGYLLKKIKNTFPKIHVEGIDIDKNLIEACQKNKLNVKYGSILNIPYANNSFDFIIAKDVIEHTPDNYKSMQELCRVSSKYIFISAPAPFTEAAWGDFFHVRPYTKTTLKHISEIFDLRIIKIKSVKRKVPYQIFAKLLMQPIDDISVYAFYSKLRRSL